MGGGLDACAAMARAKLDKRVPHLAELGAEGIGYKPGARSCWGDPMPTTPATCARCARRLGNGTAPRRGRCTAEPGPRPPPNSAGAPSTWPGPVCPARPMAVSAASPSPDPCTVTDADPVSAPLVRTIPDIVLPSYDTCSDMMLRLAAIVMEARGREAPPLRL